MHSEREGPPINKEHAPFPERSPCLGLRHQLVFDTEHVDVHDGDGWMCVGCYKVDRARAFVRAEVLQANALEAVMVEALKVAQLRLLEDTSDLGGFLDGVCGECGDETKSMRSGAHAEGCAIGANCEALDTIDAALASPSPRAAAMLDCVEALRAMIKSCYRCRGRGRLPPAAIEAHRKRLLATGLISDDFKWVDRWGAIRLLVGSVTGAVSVAADGYSRPADKAVAWAERLLLVARLAERVRAILAAHLDGKERL